MLIVNMGLVDAEQDAQIWGQQFTKRMTDIFVLQDEIAHEVIQALSLKLAGEPKRRVTRHTRNTDAYHLYLKGCFYWAKRTPENTSRALQYYQQAIEHDPGYALAYAGVADCYAHLGFNPYGTIPPKRAYPLAKAAAQKAVALDSSIGKAHASLGLCAFWYDWDWEAAEQSFRRSLELDPQSQGARVWYPFLLLAVNRFDAALAEAQRTSAADPLSFISATALGQIPLFHAALRRGA